MGVIVSKDKLYPQPYHKVAMNDEGESSDSVTINLEEGNTNGLSGIHHVANTAKKHWSKMLERTGESRRFIRGNGK